MRRTTSPSPPSSLRSNRSYASVVQTASTQSISSIRRKPVAIPHVSPISEPSPASPGIKNEYTPISAIEDDSAAARKKRKPSIWALWKWELMALIISMLSFLAIIVMLKVYTNHALSTWAYPISINAIVAILSALFKGTLAMPVTEGISQLKWLWFSHNPRSLADLELYDKASRGTWGAILLVAHQFQRGPKSLLASTGAILALIVVAVDPFSQASVTLTPCWREASPANKFPASIPRGNNYVAQGGHFAAGPSGITLDPAMKVAMYLGAVKPPANSSASVDTVCPTGSCEFPSDEGATFTTIGVCSLAWDISDQVTRQMGRTRYTYTIPWDLSLNTSLLATTMQLQSTTFDAEEWPWNRTSLVDVETLGYRFKNSSCTYKSCLLSLDGMDAVAYLMSFVPCVQTYAANFTNGTYWETKLDEKFMHMLNVTLGYQLALNRTLEDGQWKECISTGSKTDTNTVAVYPPTGNDPFFGMQSTPVWYRPSCVYHLGQGASAALSHSLGAMFLNQQLFEASTVVVGEPWMGTLWNDGQMTKDTVSRFADGMALALTAQMRSNPDGPEPLKSTRGTVLTRETCIVPEWKYLSFLAVLLALEVAFFSTVVVISWRSKWDADWKSSTLAVAFQDVGSASAARGGEVQEPRMKSDFQEAAAGVNVSFMEVNGRWQLQKEVV